MKISLRCMSSDLAADAWRVASSGHSAESSIDAAAADQGQSLGIGKSDSKGQWMLFLTKRSSGTASRARLSHIENWQRSVVGGGNRV